MRELHGYHGEHRRHAHNAATDAPATRAHDGPKHASHDSPKLRMLLDPEARKTERLKYQQKVEAAESEYAGKHAKPKPADRSRAPEQLKPQEPKPRDAPPETRELETKAALAEVDDRTLPKSGQVKDVAASQKRRVSDKDISYLGLLGSYIVKTTAEYVSVIPPHLAGDISGGLLVLAAGIVLGREKHRKDGNADRPQD